MAFGFGQQTTPGQLINQWPAQPATTDKGRVSFGDSTPQYAEAGAAPDPNVVPVAGATGGGLYDQDAITQANLAAVQQAAAQQQLRDQADVNLTAPGPGQVAWNQHGQDFFQAGPAQQWNDMHGGEFLKPDANQQAWDRFQRQGTMRNDSQTEYDAFGKRRPNIATEPGYGSYYDNAVKNTLGSLNTELAARGAYGSSVGLGQVGKSVTDLRSQQAKAKEEAQYNLDRLAEQRQWDTLGGSLARNSDLTRQGNLDTTGTLANNASQSRMAGLIGGANSAVAAGNERMNGLVNGIGGAVNVDQSRTNRIQTALDIGNRETSANEQTIGDIFQKLISGDEALTDAEYTALVAGLSESLNVESNTDSGGIGGAFKTILQAKATKS
jgi:hypothetical protein